MKPPFCPGGTYDAGPDGGTPSSNAYVLSMQNRGEVRMTWIGPWRFGGVYSQCPRASWESLAERQGHTLLFPFSVEEARIPRCTCACHRPEAGVVLHFVACCNRVQVPS